LNRYVKIDRELFTKYIYCPSRQVEPYHYIHFPSKQVELQNNRTKPVEANLKSFLLKGFQTQLPQKAHAQNHNFEEAKLTAMQVALMKVPNSLPVIRIPGTQDILSDRGYGYRRNGINENKYFISKNNEGNEKFIQVVKQCLPTLFPSVSR